MQKHGSTAALFTLPVLPALLALFAGACASEPVPGPFRSAMTDLPPQAPRRPHETEIHGAKRTDDYFWLRDKEAPEVRSYLEAENAWAARTMAPTEALQESLYAELKGRIQETDVSVPYRIGAWEYSSRTEEGKQYPTHYRRPSGHEPEDDEVLLDVNELAKGHAFMATGRIAVSPDGTLLAYTTDDKGFREYTLHFKSLVDDRRYPERVQKVDDVAWATDNKTFFYVVQDAAKRPHRVYRHELGSDPKDDVLVYEEKDERFRVGVWLTLGRDSVMIDTESHTTSESYIIPADQPTAEMQMIRPREQEHEYAVTQRGTQLFIRTNDQGRNFRLVTATTDRPGDWQELIPHREDVMLERVRVFKDFVVLTERKNGLRHLRFLEDPGTEEPGKEDSRTDHYLQLEEEVYELGVDSNFEFDTTTFRYTYQSMLTPRSIYDYDVRSRKSTLRKQVEVLGGYEPGDYETTRIHAKAMDGALVPISLAWKKGVDRDGSAPLYLQGYGAYGAPYPASFSHARVSLLDRGVVCAIAHIRGGGELGKKWHDAGKMSNKKNSFTDFIACGEHLIAEKFTRSDRMVVQGGSAGGLLMGAVLNMRPDLFKAVVMQVPFVDVIHTMLDETLPLTVGEFEEWGNPKVKEQFDYIASYCPYTNLAAGAYPAILVKTSFHDSQVMYWEPAKYVAKLRRLKTNHTPLIFHTNMAGGHGGSSGRYDAWKEVAYDYAFVLWQMGLAE